MQNITKITMLSFLILFLMQAVQAKSKGLELSDVAPKVVDTAKIVFNSLPVLISQDESDIRSKKIEQNIHQALKNGEITEKESKKKLRENCMGMINNPQDKVESFLGSLPVTGLLKGLDLLCHQYK